MNKYKLNNIFILMSNYKKLQMYFLLLINIDTSSKRIVKIKYSLVPIIRVNFMINNYNIVDFSIFNQFIKYKILINLLNCILLNFLKILFLISLFNN